MLSSIAVSDEFRLNVNSLVNEFIQSNDTSQPFLIQRQNFSETEHYYIEIFVKSKQLNINRRGDETIQITK